LCLGAEMRMMVRNARGNGVVRSGEGMAMCGQRGSRLAGVGVLVTSIGLGSGVSAASKKDTSTKVDPQAEKVIRQLAKYVGEAKTLAADISVSYQWDLRGQKQQFDLGYKFAVERPNRIAIVPKKRSSPVGSQYAGTVVCDGKALHVHGPMLKKRETSSAPKDLRGLMTGEFWMATAFAFGSLPFVPGLITGRPYEELVQDFETVEHLGQVKRNAVAYHRLRFVRDPMSWEVWITTGAKPLLEKTVMHAVAKGAEGEEGDLEIDVAYKRWAVNTKLPPDTFTFTPPPDAAKRRPQEGPAHPLLGKAAPDFELPLLEGGTLKLSGQKGKHIVILDFWATWCGPCRRALPALMAVAEKYKDKGVVFCAVNLRETPEQIKSFMRQERLSFSVGLDRRGKVGNLFQVKGIPQTVVVGKDGTVQVVHVGFLPDLETRLKQELDDLLAGKDLAGNTSR